MIVDSGKTLVIVAHPDDEALGAGGTVKKIVSNGGIVDVLVCSDGATAQHPDADHMIERRYDNFHRACSILGFRKKQILSFPDMRLDTVPHIELNIKISEFLATDNYDTVLTHHRSDVNLDHQMVVRSVLVATRPQPNQSVKTVASFFVASSTEWGSIGNSNAFVPNVYVDISESIDDKIEAFSSYVDEIKAFPHPRSLEAIRARASVCGSEVGVAYAEPFQLLRHIEC